MPSARARMGAKRAADACAHRILTTLSGDVVLRELKMTQPDFRLSRDAAGVAKAAACKAKLIRKTVTQAAQ